MKRREKEPDLSMLQNTASLPTPTVICGMEELFDLSNGSLNGTSLRRNMLGSHLPSL